MSDNNLLFTIHKDNLMEFEEWKDISSKDTKTNLLKHWRTTHTDLEIRNKWGMKISNYYYYLRTLGINKTKTDVAQTSNELLLSTLVSMEREIESYLKFDFEGDYSYIEKKMKNILALLEDDPQINIHLKIEITRK